MKYAFLSHLVSDYLARDKTFRPEKQAFVESAAHAISDLGYEVQSAGRNEQYGRIKLEPVEFTAYDIEAIQRSSLFALIASERLTQDMYLEVGVAIALGIPTFFFIPASARVTYMIYGLETCGKLTIGRYDAEAEVPDLIKRTISAVPPPGTASSAEETHWAATR